MMSIKKLNIRPDTGVYGTYKRISYEPWTALAEFIDNSTQSFYDHKDELFQTKYYKGLEICINYTEDPDVGDEIVITDNAYGMEYRDFQRAIILDRPPIKTTGRNEFGMGLKAAACWFGNLWSVETTRLGSSVKYKAEIDIEKLIKYKNEEIDVEEDTASPKDHYTIIKIQKLNKKIKGKRIEKKIHELLASIYRADFRTGNIKIYYNGILLKFEEVKPYVDQNGTQWKKDINFTIPYHNTDLHVKGFVAIRIPGSTRNAGFTLMRRGRVIVGGPDKNYRPYEVFGPTNLYTYQRMYGELEMDDWPVTQAKDGFDWSNEDLEAKFIAELVERTKDYHAFAEDLRTREKVNSKIISEQIKKTFTNNGFVSDLKVSLEETKEDNNIIPSNIKEDEDANTTMLEHENESAGTGVEIEENKPINWSMKYRGRQYNFTLIFDDSNPKSQWLKLEPNKDDNNNYKLTLNTTHSFFYPFIQKKDFLVVLAKFAVALVIAELNSYEVSQDGKIPPSSIRTTMGQILEDFKNDGQ